MICCAFLLLIVAAPALFAMRRLGFARGAAPLAWRLHPAAPAVKATEPQGFSLAARARSFGYAANGLAHLARHEHNAWIHAGVSVAVIGAGLALSVTPEDWRWLVLSIALVWASEALNTAIERVCDLVSPGPNELVRVAKDVAAGAVLAIAMAATLIGALTLWPYLEPHMAHTAHGA